MDYVDYVSDDVIASALQSNDDDIEGCRIIDGSRI